MGNINISHGTRELADKILESETRVPNSARVGSDTMGWEKLSLNIHSVPPHSTPLVVLSLSILKPYMTHVSSVHKSSHSKRGLQIICYMADAG